MEHQVWRVAKNEDGFLLICPDSGHMYHFRIQFVIHGQLIHLNSECKEVATKLVLFWALMVKLCSFSRSQLQERRHLLNLELLDAKADAKMLSHATREGKEEVLQKSHVRRRRSSSRKDGWFNTCPAAGFGRSYVDSPDLVWRQGLPCHHSTPLDLLVARQRRYIHRSVNTHTLHPSLLKVRSLNKLQVKHDHEQGRPFAWIKNGFLIFGQKALLFVQR